MKIHMVKKGESLYLIAQKYNVPLEALIGANPEIANPDVIDVGMKVKIPAPAHPAYEMMHQHTVQQGDTLWKLSKAWGIPLSDMIKANPQLKNPNVLLTGEVVNIPKLPAAGSGGATHTMPAHTMPGAMPGKKNTAVMPEAVVEEMPAAPLPAPEVKEIQTAPQAVVPEIPPMPLPMPQPMPQVEAKHPYPITFTQEIHEHNLFAQFPVPAVEAGAQAVQPCPPEAMQHAQGMNDYGGHAYYAHYNPSDWSGEAAKSGEYGEVSAAAPAQHAYMPMNVAPAAGAVHNQYATGYWPAQTAWPVSPIAGAANADDCGCGCGGASYAQPMAQPVAGAQWSYPGMAQAEMSSPSHYGHYEMGSSAYGQPTGVAPASTMPGYGQPTGVAPASTMSGYGQPTGVAPASTMSGYGQPTGVAPASMMPGFPGGMNAHSPYPTAALPGLYDPCPPYGAYGMPYDDRRYGAGFMQYPYSPVPTVAAVPGAASMTQANGDESIGGDADSLALHGAEDEATAPAPRSRKQGGAGKSKRGAPARKARPKRKESLPWIKW